MIGARAPVERLVLWLKQSAVVASPALTSEETTECAKEINAEGSHLYKAQKGTETDHEIPPFCVKYFGPCDDDTSAKPNAVFE